MPGAATRMTDTIPTGRMPGATGLDSETAAGTPMDPANVPPMIVFLSSDEAGEVTGQCFGASGYRDHAAIRIWSRSASIINNGPWDIDQLFKIFKQTLGSGLEPARMF